MTELKPCPFCGGEANYYDDGFESRDTTIIHKCKCNNCGAEIASAISPWQPNYKQEVKELIEAWNRRAEK